MNKWNIEISAEFCEYHDFIYDSQCKTWYKQFDSFSIQIEYLGGMSRRLRINIWHRFQSDHMVYTRKQEGMTLQHLNELIEAMALVSPFEIAD